MESAFRNGIWHRKGIAGADAARAGVSVLTRHYSAKADANQPEIVAAFRAAGASVGLIHRAGYGIPDLIVGYRGVDRQVEVKMPGKLGLTAKESDYHRDWLGAQVAIVSTVAEALELLAQMGN